MSSFGGLAIFGTAVQMSSNGVPREAQLNAFFGVDGVERLDGGSRGRETHVTGLLFGSDPGTLAAQEALFESYKDGVARELVDTLGVAWADVVLEKFERTSRIRQSPAGMMFRTYRVIFVHLSG
jgi:hypothetical protein